jgi:hypothetical protein
MITIKNTFHNTEVNIKVDEGQQLTLSQTQRMERVLCGVGDCKCGAGHRDPDWEIEYTGIAQTSRYGKTVYLPTFHRRG